MQIQNIFNRYVNGLHGLLQGRLFLSKVVAVDLAVVNDIDYQRHLLNTTSATIHMRRFDPPVAITVGAFDLTQSSYHGIEW